MPRLLLTGFRFAVRHPRACHPGNHSVRALMEYSLSACMSIGTSGRTADSASKIARSSIRLFVVCGALPAAQFSASAAHAHPPGPGFPRHDPSVAITNRSRSTIRDYAGDRVLLLVRHTLSRKRTVRAIHPGWLLGVSSLLAEFATAPVERPAASLAAPLLCGGLTGVPGDAGGRWGPRLAATRREHGTSLALPPVGLESL